VACPDDAEIASIERRDGRDSKALRGRDDGCIHRSERKVSIASDELGDSKPVVIVDRNRDERPAGEIGEEPHLGVRAEPGSDEMCDLRDHQDWHRERARVTLQQADALVVVRIIRVDVREQRASIDEECD